MDIKLSVYQDQTFRFTKTIHLPCTFGRSSRCDIIVGHPLVSRQHCELYEDHGLVMVRDLGSQNGTYFKGVTIGRGVVIAYGEEFSIGTIRFVIDQVKGDTAKMAIYPDDTESAPQEGTTTVAAEKATDSVSVAPDTGNDALEFMEPEFVAGSEFMPSGFSPFDSSDESSRQDEKRPAVAESASQPASHPVPDPSPDPSLKQEPARGDQDPEDEFLTFLFSDDDSGNGEIGSPSGNSGSGKEEDNKSSKDGKDGNGSNSSDGDFDGFGDDNPFFSDF